MELDFGVGLANPERVPETVAQKILMSSSRYSLSKVFSVISDFHQPLRTATKTLAYNLTLSAWQDFSEEQLLWNVPVLIHLLSTIQGSKQALG